MTTVDEIRAALASAAWLRRVEGTIFASDPLERSMIAQRVVRRVLEPCESLLAALPPAGEIHAPGTCIPVDAERLAEALIPVTRGMWSTPTQRNPDRQNEQDRRWRLNTAAAILAALAKPQEAERG